jgi:hypothetical protein
MIMTYGLRILSKGRTFGIVKRSLCVNAGGVIINEDFNRLTWDG